MVKKTKSGRIIITTICVLILVGGCVQKPTPTSGEVQISMTPLVKILEKRGEGAFPKWSPDGSLIAFTKEGNDSNDPQGISYNIYIMRPDGSEVRCLTCDKTALANTRWRGQPYWHPSGKYIAFTAESAKYPRKGIGATARPGIGRNHNVWIMTSDGSKFWQITDYLDNWGVIRPSFSHDGKTLYWNEEFSMEKYPDGKPTDPDDDPQKPGHQGHPGSYWGWENYQHRKGEELGAWRVKLADISFENGEPKISNIRAINPPDGFTLIEGTGFTPSDNGFIYSYANLKENKGQGLWGDIYISDLSGTFIQRLTNTSFVHDENPEFSPDGKNIIWNHGKGDPGDGEELWLMNADGSEQVRLTYFTDSSHEEYEPNSRQITESTWSPDGKKIIFGHVCQEERGGIHVPSTLYLLTFK
jgi:Tol biopolymer transport system component